MRRPIENEIYDMEENKEAVAAPSMLEETKALVEELKKANAERKELLDREERFKSEMLLGGRSDAGKPAVVVDVKEQERKARIKALGDITGAKWAKDMVL